MTGPCKIHQSMSLKFLSICLIVLTIISHSSPFPLRRLGVEKKVTRHVASSRDLIMCWVVQIMTNAKDNCVLREGSPDEGNDTRTDAPCGKDSSRCEFQQRPGRSCEQTQAQEHISALSEEFGLHVLHSFGQFHDHFLLCHLDISESGRELQRNLTSARSHTISQIHKLHSELKFRDKLRFDAYKRAVEDSLQQHEEVVWFSSEYVHRHHSRSTNIQRNNDINLQRVDTSSTPQVQIPDTAKHKFTRSKINRAHSQPDSESSDTLTENVGEAISEGSSNYRVRTLQNGNSLIANNIHDRNHVFHSTNTTQSIYFTNQSSLTDRELNKQLDSGSSLHSVSRRSLDINFNDPKYPQQWHLKNRLIKDMDINVTGVWMHNFTGQGVTVAVVDDGLEWMNPDLKANYNYKGSWDMNDDDPDPTPSSSKLSNHHGTRCAGEIAAVANNRICGVGAAYGSFVSGLRVLDGVMTDSMEAEAFNKNMDVNDIYSCSWGPDDDGRTVDGPHLMAAKAMKLGVDFGRHGYGSIFVLASGNGGDNHDNCNFDGYANSIYTVTIGAVDDKGHMPYYAEECASMLGVTFSSGITNKRDIVTTDWTMGSANGCTDSHTGTSAAAPLAAAMIALMLQARPCLTWRDVQYIIILTGQRVDVASAELQTNGAGFSHSHKHGFGLLNSWRLVNAARVWETVPWLTSFSHAEADLDLSIPKGKHRSLRVEHVVSELDIQGLSLFILENVQLTITLSHPCRGKIGVNLTSPAGTVSVLATPRPKDNSTDGFDDWTFTSVRCWGEKPTGNWTFHVIDYDDHLFGKGRLTKWRLTLFGTPMTSAELQERQRRVESAMGGDFLDAESLPCPPAPKHERVEVPISDRLLKILILCGAFCLIMAVYETFEYIFCYNEEKKETELNRNLAQNTSNSNSVTRDPEDAGVDSSALLNGGAQRETIIDGHGFELDDDEDDIFDASETSGLLRQERSFRTNLGVNAVPGDIPLSVFNVGTTVVPNGTAGHPLEFQSRQEDSSDAFRTNLLEDGNSD